MASSMPPTRLRPPLLAPCFPIVERRRRCTARRSSCYRPWQPHGPQRSSTMRRSSPRRCATLSSQSASLGTAPTPTWPRRPCCGCSTRRRSASSCRSSSPRSRRPCSRRAPRASLSSRRCRRSGYSPPLWARTFSSTTNRCSARSSRCLSRQSSRLHSRSSRAPSPRSPCASRNGSSSSSRSIWRTCRFVRRASTRRRRSPPLSTGSRRRCSSHRRANGTGSSNGRGPAEPPPPPPPPPPPARARRPWRTAAQREMASRRRRRSVRQARRAAP